MSEENVKNDSILAALNGSTVVVKIVGRGSFKTSPSLKAFVRQAAEESGCRRFIFDMTDCVSMDSTFMGVVAGLALRMKKTGRESLSVANLTQKTFSLLDTLGVCCLLDAFETENTPQELADVIKGTSGFVVLEQGVTDHLSSVETMLRAHEDLVRASPDNRERFQDVISYLSKDVKELKSSGQ